MNETHLLTISQELNLDQSQVQAVADLLDAEATAPFIARYRKEATGSLDEVAVMAIRDRLKQLAELDQRKEAVIKSMEQHGHLTDELAQKVMAAETLSEVEDIYLPYKPKRRTKATIAKEKGLEPLAVQVLEQTGADVQTEAASYVNPEKGVETVDEALAGARDIIAEMINEDEAARSAMRRLFAEKGRIRSELASGVDPETDRNAAKYKDYFEWEEAANQAPSHRILAMRRGEKEECLNLSMNPDEAEAVEILTSLFVKGDGPDSREVAAAVKDCYKRLLSRSMETELRVAAKERADQEAIRIFAQNLRELLMAPPLGAKRVMGIDPGFRTGCKVVCLDRQGKLLHHETIYPHSGETQAEKAAGRLNQLARDYAVEAVAVGNGTAGRETESFVRSRVELNGAPAVLVNESGASIYSASDAAREEFPELDLTVRGSVSIGRRLMDPLSELVKIDPKSIGVGQYQHDVDQRALKQALDDVVVSCVNNVGVDVNRASRQLLSYVSGLSSRLAANIVEHRNENGPFASRDVLKKVKRLGPKAFEQCAGFLRIVDGENPLDASAVHPESYPVVDRMAGELGCAVSDLISDAGLRSKINLESYVTESVGLPTLTDIMEELAKPGRDPRKTFEAAEFAGGIETMSDLRAGMRLPGVVTNVTAFGAFVDIGVHQDGLVHISEMADRFVKNPMDVVKVNQRVTVSVLDVDIDRKRISLSMKSEPGVKQAAGGRTPGSKQKQAGKPERKPPENKNQPFNNPFADLFGSK